VTVLAEETECNALFGMVGIQGGAMTGFLCIWKGALTQIATSMLQLLPQAALRPVMAASRSHQHRKHDKPEATPTRPLAGWNAPPPITP
jgi:hypothetical protein